MRLLHVSDWHIGRQTYRCSRVPDHEAALGEIVELARDTRPHLVLHTGDVFDGFRPGYVEMSFAVEALEELAALAPVVVVAGNHDFPALTARSSGSPSSRSCTPTGWSTASRTRRRGRRRTPSGSSASRRSSSAASPPATTLPA